MPPKRQSPLELKPPSASSSNEETEEGSKSEDEQQQPKSDSGSSAEDSEEDIEEEEEPKTNPSADSESDSEPVKHMIAPRNAPVTHIASAAGKRKSNGVASPQKKVAKIMKSTKVEPVEEEEEEENNKEEDGAGGLEYPYLSQSMQNNPMLPVPPEGLVGLVAKKGWDLMGANNAEALDKKWKSVLIAETKAYLQWISVVREQTKLMLDVLESSDNEN